jgi:hypothetical protein
MLIPRTAANTILLGNGKVLAVGGFSTGGGMLPSAETYDPITGDWSSVGSMHTGRWVAAACLLPNGKALIAGGAFTGSIIGTKAAELFDSTTGNWTLTGSMTNERCVFTLTVLPSGKVLAAGGFGTNGPVPTAELYDPATGIWAPTGPLNVPRGFHTATLLPNGKVLVAGGAGLPAPNNDTSLASAEIYDPATGLWTFTNPLGLLRQNHTSTLLASGKVLVAGGTSVLGSIFPTSAEIFDPATEKWSPTFPLVSGRQDHLATLLPDGKVLIAGGFNTTDTGPSTELFDPASAVAAPFLLSPPALLPSGLFQFTFRNTPGISFTVLTTANPAVPVKNWTPTNSATEISPGHYQFTDGTTKSPRFYTVRSE